MEKNLVQALVAAVLSAAIATRSYRKKSLDLSGALAGFAVMTIHIAVNYRYLFSSICGTCITCLCMPMIFFLFYMGLH